jgi:hypothetical protein
MSYQPAAAVAPPPTNVGGVSTVRDMKERAEFDRRVQNHFYPTWSKKVISWMKPDLALGMATGADAGPVFNKIMLILFGSLLMGIISTLAWHYAEGGQVNEQILVAVFSISWFIFVSFLFLLFGRTRLLHILSFLTLILLCGYVQDDYTKTKKMNTPGGNLLLVTTIIAALVGFLLLLSFATSRKDEELYELKTQIKENEEKKKIIKLLENQVKIEMVREKQEMDLEFEGKEFGIRKKISDAFITDVLVRANAGKLQGGGGGGKQQNKNKARDAIRDALTTDDKEETTT